MASTPPDASPTPATPPATPPAPSTALRPLPYHLAVRDYLRDEAPALWAHFTSDAYQQAHAEELRLALLKATYRLDRASHPDLYAHVDVCAKVLGLDVPVELYQGPDQGGLNAGLYFVPDAARVVLFGPVQERLSEAELRALLGHELSHHVLWTCESGELLAAERALTALNQAETSVSASATERLFNLHTEVFCDRGGMLAAGERDAAICCLVKVQTGLSKVNAAAYVTQADEVLAKDAGGSEGQTHPESFLRAKALATFAEAGAQGDAALRALLEGPAELDRLDLLRRAELTELVRGLLDLALAPAWMQTDATVGHARLMFDDYAVPDVAGVTLADLAASLTPYAETARQVLSWVLVDLVALEPDLAPLPLAHGLTLAEGLGLKAALVQAVNKELRVTKKAIAQVERDAAELLAAAQAEAADSGQGDPS